MSDEEKDQVQPEVPETDEVQPELTDTDGTVEDSKLGEQPATEPKKFAGIFNSVEALEESYKHLQAAYTRAQQGGVTAPPPPPPAPQTPTLADLVDEEGLGESNLIKTLVGEVQALRTDRQRTIEETETAATNATLEATQKLFAENKDIFDSPATLEEWAEDMNDRLGPYKTNFFAVLKYLNEGGRLNSAFAEDFRRKIERTTKSVRSKFVGSDKEKRRKEADARIEARAGTMGAGKETGPVPEKPKDEKGDYFAALQEAGGRRR